MTLTVPPLFGAIAYDDAETLIGTLAPTGGVGPYEVVAIWPGGAASALAPARLALAIWRGRVPRPRATLRARGDRPAAAWRVRDIRPERVWR